MIVNELSKYFRKFKKLISLEVDKLKAKAELLPKLSSLEVWKSGGLKRQLSLDFACADFINPPSCQAAQLPNFGKSLMAFTMAEILISLTIIGIISAITLPSLKANINEKTWATQRKALYSRMSQAVALMPYINGYGVGSTQTATNNNAALAFVTDGLGKVLQMNNICDSTHLKDCGLPSSFKKFKYKTDGKVNFPTTLRELNSNFGAYDDNPTKNINTKVAAFETKNGESVAVFYNPSCLNHDNAVNVQAGWTSSPIRTLVLPYMCADFIYDLNGKKGPNRIGDDIWYMTLIYSDKAELSHFDPNLLGKWFSDSMVSSYNQAVSLCKSSGGRLPSLEEGIAQNANRFIDGVSFGWLKNDGSRFANTAGDWGYLITDGGVLVKYSGSGLNVRCINKSRK